MDLVAITNTWLISHNILLVDWNRELKNLEEWVIQVHLMTALSLKFNSSGVTLFYGRIKRMEIYLVSPIKVILLKNTPCVLQVVISTHLTWKLMKSVTVIILLQAVSRFSAEISPIITNGPKKLKIPRSGVITKGKQKLRTMNSCAEVLPDLTRKRK